MSSQPQQAVHEFLYESIRHVINLLKGLWVCNTSPGRQAINIIDAIRMANSLAAASLPAMPAAKAIPALQEARIAIGRDRDLSCWMSPEEAVIELDRRITRARETAVGRLEEVLADLLVLEQSRPPAMALTPLQQAILSALDGQAMKKQQLADVVCGGEGTRLYRRGGLTELKHAGLVCHQNGVGYYRPDAPPEGLIVPALN